MNELLNEQTTFLDVDEKDKDGILKFISHKAKYIYKIRTFLLTFSVQSVIIIKLIRDSPVDRV